MPLQKHTYLIISFLSLIMFPFAKLHSKTNESSSSDSTRVNYLSKNQSSITDSVINYGKLYLNTPYHYGSPGTSSFDCSGFTSYVYRNFGYNLERSSVDQARQFDAVDKSQLKAGDLVFFSGRRKSKNVGHVGIVVSANEKGEFNFIHAAVHNGVTISSSTEAYYTKRFLKASRVIGASPILKVLHKLVNQTFNNEPETPKQVQSKTQISNFSSIQTQNPSQATNVVKQTKRVQAEYHHVKSGETLSSIAQKYGLTVAELKRKNNIKGNKLKLKQKLKVKDEETITETVNAPVNNTQIAENRNQTTKAESSKSRKDETSNQGVATHKVKKGETLFSIAKANNISVDELKQINNIPNGKIRPGLELKLNQQVEPTRTVEVAKVETSQKSGTHKVVSGESLYSIAKKYNISVDELKKSNNIPNGKIHPGQELKLTQSDNDSKTKNTVAEKADNKQVAKAEPNGNTVTYKVKKGESLITIANDNNISVEELKKLNNLTNSKIKSGQELKLTTQSSGKVKGTGAKTQNDSKSIQHKVKSGESFYSIAKDYGCTVDELKEWNKKTGSKIKIGDQIVVYSKGK